MRSFAYAFPVLAAAQVAPYGVGEALRDQLSQELARCLCAPRATVALLFIFQPPSQRVFDAMLSPRVEWFLNYCSCTSCDTSIQSELQVQLSTDLADHSKKGLINRADSFDITFTPRSFGNHSPRSMPTTPRQRDLKEQLELPQLHTYPVPPNSSAQEPEGERKRKLLEMYQEFALELHTGMYMTQLTSNRDYSDIHCQLMDDMQTLQLDQSNGRIIEFPLTGVSKVYRIVKSDDKWYSAGSHVPGAPSASTEHIVVVEFMRRKLAFVFKELQMSQRFLMGMELLIRRAQQKQAKKALRSLTPAFPQQGGAAGNKAR